ncbi:MAG: GNAT family N-acetyltransferase [Ramlibacter sp.]
MGADAVAPRRGRRRIAVAAQAGCSPRLRRWITAIARRPLCISSLVVMPAVQRHGVASALLLEVLRRFGSQALVVSTAAGNIPALSLYGRFGFIELDRRFAGTLALVQLGRATMPPEP